MALSSAMEPLRSVNRLTGEHRYHWDVIGLEPGQVEASNGLSVAATHGIADSPQADLTIVVASLDLESLNDRALGHFLRQVRRRCGMLGAISNGSLILARAGLLDGRQATIHWEMQPQLAEAFPDIEVSDRLFCWDRDILTCGGGTASMDMMLELISRKDGHDVAVGVSEQFLHGPARTAADCQRQDVRWRYRITDPRLEVVITVMESRISNPVKVSKLAEIADLSERQLERLFRTEFNKCPSQFYLALRLKSARARLLGSTESIESIADATGFSSQAHLSRATKDWCGESPLFIRKQFRAMNVGSMQKSGDLT
jgi:transcriptional regulator GlxA family with amidase domain